MSIIRNTKTCQGINLGAKNRHRNVLLFTPFSVTRFAMHRIYAIRINSRGMSRDFGIFMPKHLAG